MAEKKRSLQPISPTAAHPLPAPVPLQPAVPLPPALLLPPPRKLSPNLIEHVPQFMREYVFDIREVSGDGNCGFRAIAEMMDIGQENWYSVRQFMINELRQNVAQYMKVYQTDQRYQQVLQGLTVAPNEFVLIDKWLSIPDMGHLVASAYKVVFVTISKKGCTTFFPHFGHVPHALEHRFVTLLHVNENHWVQV